MPHRLWTGRWGRMTQLPAGCRCLRVPGRQSKVLEQVQEQAQAQAVTLAAAATKRHCRTRKPGFLLCRLWWVLSQGAAAGLPGAPVLYFCFVRFWF